jgi:hypothetical protein
MTIWEFSWVRVGKDLLQTLQVWTGRTLPPDPLSELTQESWWNLSRPDKKNPLLQLLPEIKSCFHDYLFIFTHKRERHDKGCIESAVFIVFFSSNKHKCTVIIFKHVRGTYWSPMASPNAYYTHFFRVSVALTKFSTIWNQKGHLEIMLYF